MPWGNLLLLTNESQIIDGQSLTVDVIREVTTSGEEVWQWNASDYLDTQRFPGNLSLQETRGSLDWTHGNALYHVEDDNSILLSLRSQSWVVKLAYDTRDIIWILGSDEGIAADYSAPFLALQSGSWQTAQHAATVTQNGDILLYDNRNESNGASENSRAVTYAIDEQSGQATQTWEFIAPKYTQSLGDADELPNGNILVTAGGPGSSSHAYISEVDAQTGDTLWEISVNHAVYRAERVSWEEMLQIQF